MDLTPQPVPPAEFDWRRYASATLAGLTPIIPLPLVDGVVEALLARRVPGAVADTRGRELDPRVAALFRPSRSWPERATGCLLTPVRFLIMLPLKLFRKVLIFLTVRAVANKLAEHWTRAYLIDLALGRGELDAPATARQAIATIRHVVGESDEPLIEAGRQVFKQLRKLPLRSLLQRAEADADAATRDASAQAAREEVSGRWNQIAAALEARGRRYVAVMESKGESTSVPTEHRKSA